MSVQSANKYLYEDGTGDKLRAQRFGQTHAVVSTSGPVGQGPVMNLDETERVKFARFLLEGTGFMAVMTPAKASEVLSEREQALREADRREAEWKYQDENERLYRDKGFISQDDVNKAEPKDATALRNNLAGPGEGVRTEHGKWDQQKPTPNYGQAGGAL
jgi:hypothetical protein